MAVAIPSGLGRVLAHFRLPGEPLSATPWRGGHINSNWRVECASPPHEPTAFLLQCISSSVFPEPWRVAENGSRVARFLARALRQRGQVDTSRECLTHVPTTGGADWLVDDDGRCWRLFLFVPGTRSLERPASAHEAREAARAYGAFLQLLTEYDGPPLHRTLHRFHDTAWRFECLEQAASADPCGRLASCRLEVGALLEAADLARALSLHPGPGVPERIVHNDARLANLLFDERAARALCVVDLDTVMPGTALYDFGDLVRSAATTAPEDAEDPGQVEANEELFEALVQGYLETAGTVLTQSERALLATAGRILTLEQAARFLTDWLEGDRYYRIEREDHNLVRARAQLALYADLTRRAQSLERIVERVGTQFPVTAGGGPR